MFQNYNYRLRREGMFMGQSAKDRILEHGIIAICRKIYRDDLRHAVEAMYELSLIHI